MWAGDATMLPSVGNACGSFATVVLFAPGRMLRGESLLRWCAWFNFD